MGWQGYDNKGDVEGLEDEFNYPGRDFRLHRLDEAVNSLKLALTHVENRNRLHPIEQQIADEIIAEQRYLRCEGCLRWLERLLKKARGEI